MITFSPFAAHGQGRVLAAKIVESPATIFQFGVAALFLLAENVEHFDRVRPPLFGVLGDVGVDHGVDELCRVLGVRQFGKDVDDFVLGADGALGRSS